MEFSTKDIPQADRLDKVVLAIEAISAGASSDVEIAEAIGFTPRQARYYRHAAEILGFIRNQNNHAVATEYGITLSDSPSEEKNILVKNAILKNEILRCVVNYFERENSPISEQELISFLLSIVSSDSSDARTTITRRVKTILSWLEYIEIIKEDEESYRYNDKFDPTATDLNVEDSVYPSNYSQEVDIKEERFSVFELLRKIDQNKIRMNPEFQRNLVWKPYQKSQFIESIILNVPLPPFYFRKELDGKYTIVDGLQRTSTLNDFLDSTSEQNFSLTGLNALPSLNGKYFVELSDELKTRIEDKSLLMYVLQPSVPMVVVYDIFNRINTGGTQLERQEIRNCIFIGHSTILLKRISENTIFKEAIDFGISPTRMKDREAILRCLAFQIFDYHKEYNNSMDEFLERAMKHINKMQDNQLKKLEIDFLEVLRMTTDFFGNINFRLPTDYSRGRINIAIMESVSHYFFHADKHVLNNNKEKIISKYENVLLRDEEYLGSVRYSTGSTSKVKIRFSKVHEILSSL